MPNDPSLSAGVPAALVELKRQLQEAIDRFERDSNRHKKLTFRTQLGTILLAGFTTIVSGWGLVPEQASEKDNFQIATVILGAATTALAAWISYRNYRELWRLERQVFYSLKDLLRAVILQEKLDGTTITRDQIIKWFEQFNQILTAASDGWAQLFAKQQAEKVAEIQTSTDSGGETPNPPPPPAGPPTPPPPTQP